MSTDFIPAKDAEFDTWISNFQAYVAAHALQLLRGLALLHRLLDGDPAPLLTRSCGMW